MTTIRPLATQAEYEAAVELQQRIWGPDFNERVPTTMLRLAQHLGGIASGAFAEDGALVGMVFGLTGLRDGQPVHWSDMLGVHPDARDRGLGEALKRHQREVLLAAGIMRVQWTFDPLEARNAWLNFGRLGASSRVYQRDVYASSESPLHAGIATDRLIVDWFLDDARTVARLSGATRAPSLDELRAVPCVNPVRGSDEWPDCDDADTGREELRLIVAVPAAIQEIKRAAPALATRWRAVTRAALEAYLERGWILIDAARGPTWTALVLEHEA